MTTTRKWRFGSPVWLAVVLFALGMVVEPVFATDFRMQAQLIWGTNGEKPDKPEYTAVAAKQGEKLGNVFKWKHYYQTKCTPVTVSTKGSEKVTLSDSCALELKHLGDSNFEIKMIGKGNAVLTRRQSIPKGETTALAWGDKNDTAWFVVITQVDGK